MNGWLVFHCGQNADCCLRGPTAKTANRARAAETPAADGTGSGRATGGAAASFDVLLSPSSTSPPALSRTLQPSHVVDMEDLAGPSHGPVTPGPQPPWKAPPRDTPSRGLGDYGPPPGSSSGGGGGAGGGGSSANGSLGVEAGEPSLQHLRCAECHVVVPVAALHACSGPAKCAFAQVRCCCVRAAMEAVGAAALLLLA